MGKHEYRWAFWAALGIMVLASAPYLVGLAVAPHGFKFVGFTYNIDDAFVYMSWMRQAADGHFFLRNLFTTEHQVANGFNVLFLFLGTFARVTHLPLVAVFHLARFICGMALLLAVYAFSGIWVKEVRSRRIVLMVTGLSAGLGWIRPMNITVNVSADTWQSEAITFLSVYLSPLYSFPTLLMLGIVYCLHMLMETRAWKYSVFAGLMLLVLANVHTYDLVTLGAVWALYVIYRLARGQRNLLPILGGLVALLIASPLIAYQIHFYYSEAVFRTRAAVATPTLPPQSYLLGYGLLIPLMLAGVWDSIRNRREIGLLVCWMVAGFICVYLPLSFQRKLIMGTHIPISLMAAMGLIALTERLRPRLRSVVVGGTVLLLAVTNLAFLARDSKAIVGDQPQTMAHVPFLSDKEMGALEYLRTHAGDSDIVLALPALAVMIPGSSGKGVYLGHWAETMGFQNKLLDVLDFYLPNATDTYREEFLRTHGITYVVGYHNRPGLRIDSADFREHPLPELQPVYDTDEISVYKVDLKSLRKQEAAPSRWG